MSAFLQFMINALILLGSLAGFLGTVGLVLWNTQGWTERILRGLTVFVGTLMVMGADAARLTFSSFAVKTLSHPGPPDWPVEIAWIAAGGGAGALLARYLISMMGRGTKLQMRVIILITVITHVELLEIYVQNLERNGFIHGMGQLPDLAFLCGLILYVIFTYDTGDVRAIRSQLSGRARRSLFGRRSAPRYAAEPPLAPAEEYPHLFGEQSAQPREPQRWT
jgi:hypothetical protein